MKRHFYIFTPGQLKRKDNTIFFIPFKKFEFQDFLEYDDSFLFSDVDVDELENKDKLVIPINEIDTFNIMTDITLNTKFIDFCTQNNIPIHFFNYYGFYSGTFYPREFLLSGKLLINQVDSYSHFRKRLIIARRFVEGAVYNIVKNLKYYNSRKIDLSSEINQIAQLSELISVSNNISELMGIEGNIRKIYYSTFEKILGNEFALLTRKFHPPTNPINSLISFLNSLVYISVLSEIYKTQLNPTISFLHEPGERRFSLALDIAEIFKPIFADRIIFKLINNRQIQSNDFDIKYNGVYIKENARKIIVKEFDDKMKTVIKHKDINREVSYRRIVRLECYKLIKHILDDCEYEPFKIWW
ncbi:MAG TPA: type I-B CRISPR-associated endonuclease Cas1b [Candidatus Kapabacteria bacterium]|nr:type I-B CRISPR-associated endonuclease Cas1b [Candidatus Kapabacteria bacterium]HOM06012.1 type I-B CRISPR-associated endonuclease Cas1b [Candidatus Kapabacteria bacterium]